MDNWGLVFCYMSYLVHPNRNGRWKTLSVPVRKQLLSGKHVCSPQRNPLAVDTVLKANVFLNADSLHSSPVTQENFVWVFQSVFFRFIFFYTTVGLIASFASVFYVNACLGILDDSCMALRVSNELCDGHLACLLSKFVVIVFFTPQLCHTV